MKPIQKLVVLVFLFTSFNSAFAQYSNSGYGGGYNRGYGSGYGGGSRMGQMNGGMSQERDKPKEIPVEVTVGKIMDNLKSRIDLDELQVIAISNILTESIRSQGIIMKQETSQEAKINDIKALSEITDSKVMVLLNSDQKEKYLLMKDEFKNPKKSKSDKKSKKEAKKEKESEE
ncbi:hypothetical protein [Flavobacterium sp. 123]|jgi:hypothetical protein|uniref:hypothetical protein n=1 Tax=Flavobacterium sp. 123 TaxID=2135627 RepID=UPI000EB03FEB|nr:hypothetical protein [Flavobacterium sp. 123]RKS98530.1 hypothetical protein C8C88_0269 [Flavobacterium sp. 123]